MPAKGKGKANIAVRSSVKASDSSRTEPPPPFSRAPSTLEPFLSKLSPKHVYLTHIDNTPRDFKTKIFVVPTLVNLAAVALLLWRINYIGPYYMRIFMSLAGNANETTMTPAIMTWRDISYETARRAFTFLTDLSLYLFVLPSPQAFFIGIDDIGSPVGWRYAVGFREKEIIIRRSKRWDEKIGDVVSNPDSPGGQDFKEHVMMAIAISTTKGRTAYSMLSKQWGLDWWAMGECTKMVDKNEMSLEDFKTTILVYSEKYGWVMESQKPDDTADEEEGRKKIVAFKDELTSMGKESLFFRWIELIQYETSQPGGFGPERQAVTMEKAKQMFESAGVDFEKFWQKVGGAQGLPGMDQFDSQR
ncbi:MAG: hypothetical protein M1818_003110 [Claussenomyces sp. TS43310]|nr:MAG: hypothetical protein M1818_003110 [Claussenomyces sp. TS43310]